MHLLISKKIIIYLLLFFLLGTVNNYSIVNFSLPKIKNVEIYGIDLNESAKIRNIIEKSNINNIFSINHPNLKKNIDSINTIEKFEIFKNYPSTLKVKIKKTKFVAFSGGYHGDTFGAMSVGKTTGFYKPFEDILHKNSFIPFPNPPINSEILLPPKRNRITTTIIKICQGPIATRLIKDI